jgi:3-oxoacyl-[acyl-carrier-protein] synthase I
MVDDAGELIMSAALPDAAASATLSARMLAHAQAAAADAFREALRAASRRFSAVHLALALPEPRPGAFAVDAHALLQELVAASGVAMPSGHVAAFPNGHAGGALALGWCARRIAEDASCVALVGGIDSYFEADTIDWLLQREQLKTEFWPWGFIPGEAAVFLALTAGGAPGSALIRSVALAREPVGEQADDVCIGQGLTRAASRAIAKAQAPIDYLICDMNGDPYRADEFGYTTVRIAGNFTDGMEFQTPADCVGDVGAASMPLHLALASCRRRASNRREHVLVLGSSFSRERGAATLLTP